MILIRLWAAICVGLFVWGVLGNMSELATAMWAANGAFSILSAFAGDRL
jgi:hypothetical protein